ncbi:YesN/AraC family two-component response regulator [Bacillus sp. 3255]|uniref:helix-turn-helix domain-containing protein n=1 Tax=unclassified Paenibacillus TaxID=185978 RepID=UPI002378DD6E|nr:helix-turn-helix domain-containing protein [Paenibacillus sp. MAHUQ-63]MDR6878416.1 YesN/AraC family two-component response regulator [Bacillus sp. 3255]
MPPVVSIRQYLRNLPRVFWTYFISYLVVILLPIMILSYASYSFTISTLENELSQATIQSAKQKNASVEKMIEEMQSIAIRIGLDGRIASYVNDPANTFLLNETRDILKTAATANEAIQSIDFYATGANLIIASDGYTRTYAQSPRDIWIQEGMSAAESGFWLSSRQGNELDQIVTYVLKVPVQRKDFKGLLAVHMHESALKASLRKMEGNPHTTTYILDRSGNVITSSSLNPLDAEHVGRIVQTIGSAQDAIGYTIAKQDGDRNLITYVKTLHNKWSIVSETPLQYLLSKLAYVRSVAWMTCTLLVALGVILSYFMSRKMYSPIKSLMDKTLPYNRNGEGQPSGSPQKNELETISSVLDHVFSKNEAWERQFRMNLPALRERFLLALLGNKFSNIQEINGKLEFLHIRFAENGLVVFLIEIDEYSSLAGSYSVTDQNLYKYAMLNIVEELASAKYECLSAETDENRIVLLINLDTADLTHRQLKEELARFGEAIQQVIAQLLKISVTIGVGTPFSHILETHYAYKEASEVIRAKMVAGMNTVLFYEDHAREADYEFYLPPHFSQHIINFVKAGQTEEALERFMELYSQIKARTKLNEEVIFRTYSLIVEDMLRNLNDLNVNTEHIFGTNHNLFRELASKETLHAIHEWICGIVKRVGEGLQQLQPKKNTYIETVIAYMDEHYHLDLSVEMIAEQVKLNHAYLSRMFKQEIGKTMLEYLTLRRLEVSKTLLQDTDQTINEIAANVGYNNVNSFIRFFKRYEGLTPGDFRKSIR